jgi:hypothetical protein
MRSPDGPQVGGTACVPYPARLSVVVSYLDRGATGVCSHVSKSRLVGVGGGCRPSRRGQCHDHCGLVSSGLAWAVQRHGSGWTGVSEATVVAGDTDCSAGIPTGKHEFGRWRLSAGGPAQVQRRSQQVALAGDGSVLHHRRGLSVLSARSSSPSTQRTGLRVWRGADLSPVGYVRVVGNRSWPGRLTLPPVVPSRPPSDVVAVRHGDHHAKAQVRQGQLLRGVTGPPRAAGGNWAAFGDGAGHAAMMDLNDAAQGWPTHGFVVLP